MRKFGTRKDPKTYNLIMFFAEQIEILGMLWAILYANPTATSNLLTGLGFTLPYFPFAFSVFIIVFLTTFCVNLKLTLEENFKMGKRVRRK